MCDYKAKKVIELYFVCKLGNQDISRAPRIYCASCVTLFTGSMNRSRHMPFAIPMVWQDHSKDFYFCAVLQDHCHKDQSFQLYYNQEQWNLDEDEDVINIECCGDLSDAEETIYADLFQNTYTEPHLIIESEFRIKLSRS